MGEIVLSYTIIIWDFNTQLTSMEDHASRQKINKETLALHQIDFIYMYIYVYICMYKTFHPKSNRINIQLHIEHFPG